MLDKCGEWFAAMLNRSLAAGVIVLAVMLLRLLLRRAPRKYIFPLWGIAALRLILPVSLKSSLSAFNLLSNAAGKPYAFRYFGAGVKPMMGVVTPSLSPGGASLAVQESAEYLPPWFLLWLLVAVGLLLYAAVSCLRLRRSVAASVPLGDGLWLCDGLAGPFILGVFRSCIYLPSGMEPGVRASVVAHERMHLRRLDHVWKPLGYLLLVLNWFNPLLWLGYVLFCRDMEMACDEAVVSGMDAAGRGSYARALVSCAVNRHIVTACPLAFGEVGVKERVKHVMYYKKPAFWIVLAAAAACIVTAVCLLTSPAEKTAAETAFSADYYNVWLANGCVPWYMQPDTVLVVDSNLSCAVQQGGALTAADVKGRQDIVTSDLNYDSAEERTALEPNTKIEYDSHGFLQNIYYEVPGQPGTYQLSRPGD